MAVVWIERMAIDSRGDGDAVVFVHGLGGTMNAWTPLLPVLSRWRCVRVELPGAGRSTRAHDLSEASPHRGRISEETHAAALVRACQSLGITRAHFVAHSFGTLIAQHVANLAPGLVRSLALFGALLEPPPAMRENMTQRAASAREQGLLEIAEAISSFALSASSKETQPVTVAYVRESVAAQDAEGFARNCLALAQARPARTELIACPVLIVNGDEDAVTPLSGARDLARRLQQSRVEVLSRCGHWPMQERTADCQRLLRDFLDHQR